MNVAAAAGPVQQVREEPVESLSEAATQGWISPSGAIDGKRRPSRRRCRSAWRPPSASRHEPYPAAAGHRQDGYQLQAAFEGPGREHAGGDATSPARGHAQAARAEGFYRHPDCDAVEPSIGQDVDRERRGQAAAGQSAALSGRRWAGSSGRCRHGRPSRHVLPRGTGQAAQPVRRPGCKARRMLRSRREKKAEPRRWPDGVGAWLIHINNTPNRATGYCRPEPAGGC